MHEIKHREGIWLEGQFKIKVYDNVGSLQQFQQFLREDADRKDFGFWFEKKNLIVNLGLMLTTRALYKSSNKGIIALAFGSGGAPAEDPLTPIPPVVTDTELNNEVFRVPIDSANITYVDVPPISVTYTSIITSANYSGISYINEAALVGNVNKPSDPVSELDTFSMVTFPSIPFTGSIIKGIIAEWTLFVKASSASS
jgi:hypothetical protein